MAIKYAHHIDLGGLELQNAKLHQLTSDPTGAKALVYFNTASGNNYPKYHNGSSWIRFGTVYSVSGGNGLTGSVTSSGSLAVGQGDGISVTANAVAVDSTVVRTSGTQTIGGDKTFSNNVTIGGNLTVNGTVTTVNTETINLADNIITLNSNHTGSPTQDGGISIERGSESDVALIWDESANRWAFTNNGTTYYNVPVPSEYNDKVYNISTLAGANSSQKKIRLSDNDGVNDDIIIAVSGGLGISESGDTITINSPINVVQETLPAGQTSVVVNGILFGTASVSAYDVSTGEEYMVRVAHNPSTNEITVSVASGMANDLAIVAQGYGV